MPDPFFEELNDGQWNALVGRQGDELNYVDGYIEAAQVLAGAIIDGQLYGKRDTLILPILYNARHAVELVLKYAINRLKNMGAIPTAHKADHDIKSHWKHLHDANVGDLTVRDLVASLGPYVDSLSSIDEDGQELRYATTRAGVASMANHATVNIQLVRESLDGLATAIKDLVSRVSDLRAERVTKTFTPQCSRRDLFEIACIMGARSTWNNSDFETNRAEVCDRYGLSNGKFSAAIKAILASRELAAVVGTESTLKHLSDEKAVAAMQAWVAWDTQPRERSVDLRIRSGSERRSEFMARQQSTLDFDATIAALLSVEELADLGALYELGLLRGFGERYEDIVADTLARYRAGGGLAESIPYLMHKTTLLGCVLKGAKIAGKPSLSDKLAAVVPAAA